MLKSGKKEFDSSSGRLKTSPPRYFVYVAVTGYPGTVVSR